MPRVPASTSGRNVDFFCAAVIVGLLAGVAGLSTTFVLRFVPHLIFNYSFGTIFNYSFGTLPAVLSAGSPVREVLGPMVGAALAGLGGWMLPRCRRWPKPSPATNEYRGCPGALTPCCRRCWSARGHPWGGRAPHANSPRR